MIDMHQMMELLTLEPGHGLVQCVLLFMIWVNSLGLKPRLEKIEKRITILETHEGVK